MMGVKLKLDWVASLSRVYVMPEKNNLKRVLGNSTQVFVNQRLATNK
jgi:hypothetical protein